jgi:chorismate synthase
MASNSFGTLFRITTFGESHGPAIGVVIDGCPAGLPLTKEEIDLQLARRRPGNPHTSPRKESDISQILSGLFEGKTTGAPIAILIPNQDADSGSYETMKNVYRPGHANFTYLHKYGLFDYRGGGRASGRETAARVAAGAVAKKLLAHYQIDCVAHIAEIGGISVSPPQSLAELRAKTYASPIFCPDPIAEQNILHAIEQIRQENDSLGGIIACTAHLPPGLGDPVYAKLEALLASAMLSLPATKGFEIGAGFAAARMKGSEHNDPFDLDPQGNVITSTNFAGGTLGGISTGSPLTFRVAFKPTSSIRQPQPTVSLNKEKTTLVLPPSSRHDPCVAIRAVPIVEAMTALVLADALLLNRSSKL